MNGLVIVEKLSRYGVVHKRLLIQTIITCLVLGVTIAYSQPTHRPGWPIALEPAGNAWTFNNIAVTKIPDQGKIIATATNYMLTVLDINGNTLPGWPVTFNYNDEGVVEQGPRLGDITGDGIPEVIVRTHKNVIRTYYLTGELLSSHCFTAPIVEGINSRNSGSPVLVDVNGDHCCELFLLADTLVLGLDLNGNALPGFPRYAGEDEVLVNTTPCIGIGEHWEGISIIVWMTRNYLHAQELESGEYLPGFPTAVTPQLYCSPLTLVSLEDGQWLASLVDMDSLFVFNQNGERWPGFPFENPFINGNSEASYDVIPADLDGNGIPELMYHPFDSLVYALTLGGELFTGFPKSIGSLGSGEPFVVLRETVQDSCYIFGISNSATYFNTIYGQTLNQALEGFPLVDSLANSALPNGQTAIFPPENGNMILIGYNFRGFLVAYNVPMPGHEFEIYWPMPGCTMGGNRLYQPQTYLNVKEDRSESLPVEFEDTIYPNPSNGGFRFQLTPDQSGQARISIYDVLGRLVFEESLSGIAGQRLDYTWSAASAGIKLAAGTYFIRLKGENTSTHRVVLLP